MSLLGRMLVLLMTGTFIVFWFSLYLFIGYSMVQLVLWVFTL